MSGEDIVLLTFALLPAVFLGALLLFRRFGLQRRTPRVPFLVLGNALVLLFLLSLVLFGGEIHYRFLFDESESLGLTKVSHLWFDRHWTRNAQGYRDNSDYLPRPPLGHPRVTFIGDSFTTGHGLPDVEHRFANLIRREHQAWDVQVIARNGWNTLQEIEILDTLRKDRYVLDRVVLVYTLNDIGPLVPGCHDVLKELYDAPDPGLFLRESYFLDLLYQRMLVGTDPRVRRFFDHLCQGYEGEIWRRQARYLSLFPRTVRSLGGRPLVVTFPCLHEGIGEGQFRPVHEKLASLWRSLGVPHLDLVKVFRGMDHEDLVVNAHDAHPNERAHAMAAEAIAAFLAPQMGR